MEAQPFAPAYSNAVYKTSGLTFTLTEEPNETVLFSNRSYAIITAHNPRSEKLSARENEKRHTALENVLQERGLEFSPSTGESPDSSWREEGFIIFEVSLEDALELGKNFGQHAIIYGRGNRVALAWCEGEKLDWFYPFIID
jgi:Protein of unknown function (DUF3293)